TTNTYTLSLHDALPISNTPSTWMRWSRRPTSCSRKPTSCASCARLRTGKTPMRNQRLPLSARICAVAVAALAVQGCATPSPPPAVVSPHLDPGPLPVLVEQTQAKPAGYFQRILSNCCSLSPPTPTASTSPTPPAAKTQ